MNFSAIHQAQLPDLLRAMPKTELHIHIEGSLEPALIFAMAKRNDVRLNYASVDELRSAYAFTDLQSFLDIYYAGASVLQQPQDFYDMAWAYFLRAKADNVVHAEIFFDPQTHTERKVSMRTVMTGLHNACVDAKEKLGISSSLIMCFLRHLSEESAFDTLEQAIPFKDWIIGVGLDSSERGHPPEKFERVFARARQLGLKAVAHGVQAIHDAALLKRLAAERIPLTVCPLSNLKLCVFPDLSQHNLAEMLKQGVCVMLNSDDPAYFGGYLNDNFIQTFEALRLDASHAYQLASHSFEASFVTQAQKQIWQHQLVECFKQFGA
jgi:adenine deaminase